MYSRHKDIRLLAKAVPGIIIQDMAPNTVRKYSAAFSAWQKWTEPKGIKVPTSGPVFSLYLVHLLQTTDQGSKFATNWSHMRLDF